MGQDISGTNLATTAAAGARKPTFRFLVNWHDDATGFSGGTWTDESAYVLSMYGIHEAVNPFRSVALLGAGTTDQVTILCRNPEESGGSSGLRFSTSNSSGSLYTYIADGGIYMKRAIVEMGFYDGGSPERLRQITGYIVDADEDFDRRTISFTVRDRSVDMNLTRVSTNFTDVPPYSTAKQYLQHLCGLSERDTIASGDQQLDDGFVITPYYWADEETIWEEMGIVAESQGGRIWFDKDGDLHFDDAAHWVKPNSNSYDDPTTSQASFTTSSFAGWNPQVKYDMIFNHVVAEYTPRYLGVEQVIFDSGETVVSRPSTVLIDGYVDIQASFRHPAYTVTTPEEDTDWVAVNAAGFDMSSDQTVALQTTNAASAVIRLTNGNGLYTCYFPKLQVRGYPLLVEESAKFETENSGSITDYGKRTLDIRRNPYIQSRRHAQALASFCLLRYKDPVRHGSLFGIPARPWLEVGDRITITETLSGTSGDWFINRLTWDFNGKSYRMSIDCMKVGDVLPYSDYFILGTSAYGTTARIFW